MKITMEKLKIMMRKYGFSHVDVESLLNMFKELGIEIQEKLKPCPLCGGKVVVENNPSGSRIGCSCGLIYVPGWLDENMTIKYWNSRWILREE